MKEAQAPGALAINRLPGGPQAPAEDQLEAYERWQLEAPECWPPRPSYSG